MSLRLKCTGCGALLNIPEHLAGGRVRCKQCQTIVTVPRPGKAAAPGSRPSSASPPTVILVEDQDEEDEDKDEEGQGSKVSAGFVALVVGVGLLVLVLIGVGVWWFWPRHAPEQAEKPPEQQQDNRFTLPDKYIQEAANLDKVSPQERKEFFQRLRQDVRERKVFFFGTDAEALLDKLLPHLQDKEIRPLLLELLHEKTEPVEGWELKARHWAQLAKLDIKSLTPEEKRALLGIVQNLSFANQDPNHRYLAKVLAEDPDLKGIASKPEVQPPLSQQTLDLEKVIERLRGKPDSKQATPLLAAALRALRTQRPKDTGALFQAIQPYLDDSDLRNAYLARVILLRTASPDRVVDVLIYGDLPKVKPSEFFTFSLNPEDLLYGFGPNEPKNFVIKYLSEPAVQKKLLELAKDPHPRFQEALAKLLLYVDRLPGELLESLFIQNPQVDGDTISRWLATYTNDPLPVSLAALTILARTKNEGVRKAIVNWFQNCKPPDSERLRFQSEVRERCEELMKDSNAAPNVFPILVLVTTSPLQLRQYAKHPDPQIRHIVLERLADDAQFGATDIIPHLAIPQDQQKAKQLLLQMFDKHGANAVEPAIISQLNFTAKTNPGIILPLLEILRDKGTANSLPVLQLYSKYPNPQIAKTAQLAIVEIKKRGS
jgi:hypothetical protein